MYMNVHKTGFSAVFHKSVMIFKLAHLIHLDLDHQNVFRQFHVLFYQNQINSSIRLSGIRLSGIRLSGIRLSGIRLSGIRYPSFLPCPHILKIHKLCWNLCVLYLSIRPD